MKTDKNSFEPFLSLLKIIYMCGVLLYFMFLTRSAWGQTVDHIPTRQYGLVLRGDQQRIKLREIYTSQIGVREKGPNSGQEVEKYLRYVNLKKGNPWCAAFVCWVYGEAGVGNPRSGWSPALFGDGRIVWGSGVSSIRYQVSRFGVRKFHNSAPNNADGIGRYDRFAYPTSLTSGFRLLTSDPRDTRTAPHKLPTPNTGDVFGLYFPEKARIAHVGFIDEWKDPWVVTVEGNTNVLGSREGDGVYRKRRLVRSLFQVARYVE